MRKTIKSQGKQEEQIVSIKFNSAQFKALQLKPPLPSQKQLSFKLENLFKAFEIALLPEGSSACLQVLLPLSEEYQAEQKSAISTEQLSFREARTKLLTFLMKDMPVFILPETSCQAFDRAAEDYLTKVKELTNSLQTELTSLGSHNDYKRIKKIKSRIPFLESYTPAINLCVEQVKALKTQLEDLGKSYGSIPIHVPEESEVSDFKAVTMEVLHRLKQFQDLTNATAACHSCFKKVEQQLTEISIRINTLRKDENKAALMSLTERVLMLEREVKEELNAEDADEVGLPSPNGNRINVLIADYTRRKEEQEAAVLQADTPMTTTSSATEIERMSISMLLVYTREQRLKMARLLNLRKKITPLEEVQQQQLYTLLIPALLLNTAQLLEHYAQLLKKAEYQQLNSGILAELGAQSMRNTLFHHANLAEIFQAKSQKSLYRKVWSMCCALLNYVDRPQDPQCAVDLSETAFEAIVNTRLTKTAEGVMESIRGNYGEFADYVSAYKKLYKHIFSTLDVESRAQIDQILIEAYHYTIARLTANHAWLRQHVSLEAGEAIWKDYQKNNSSIREVCSTYYTLHHQKLRLGNLYALHRQGRRIRHNEEVVSSVVSATATPTQDVSVTVSPLTFMQQRLLETLAAQGLNQIERVQAIQAQPTLRDLEDNVLSWGDEWRDWWHKNLNSLPEQGISSSASSAENVHLTVSAKKSHADF